METFKLKTNVLRKESRAINYLQLSMQRIIDSPVVIVGGQYFNDSCVTDMLVCGFRIHVQE
jgi:hypothetical protein